MGKYSVKDIRNVQAFKFPYYSTTNVYLIDMNRLEMVGQISIDYLSLTGLEYKLESGTPFSFIRDRREEEERRQQLVDILTIKYGTKVTV